MSIPIKSRRLEAARQWLNDRPVIAFLLAALAFLVIALPEWGAAVWQLFSAKPFFVWLPEKMKELNLSQYSFSPTWVTTPVGLLALFFILFLVLTGRRKAKSDESKAKDTSAFDTQLREFAEYQRTGLRKYVLVEKCSVNSSPLSEGKLYVEFTFSVANYSMFYISIPTPLNGVLEGSIRFKGDLLSGAAKLIENRVIGLPPYSTNYFTVRQWVSPHEAKDILETLKKSGNLFNFSEFIVNIGGADERQRVETGRLDLTRGMQNTELENKIIQLEVELKEEKAAQERLKSEYENQKSEERRRKAILNALQYPLGAARLIEELYDEKELVPEKALKYLAILASSSVEFGFSDSATLDFFHDALRNIPHTPEEQRQWFRALQDRLKALSQNFRG
jgi:hypothetical protein